jgi:hypothetical protein
MSFYFSVFLTYLELAVPYLATCTSKQRRVTSNVKWLKRYKKSKKTGEKSKHEGREEEKITYVESRNFAILSFVGK